MRTTLTLDDELLAQAQQIRGLTERTQLPPGILAISAC
jgi:Arc/MetJ family transcription regulator